MGIPQYFSWLTRKYNNIVSNDKKDIIVDHLYFDFNCLIYHVLNDILKKEYDKLKNKNSKDFRSYLFKNIIKYINFIITDVCIPKKSLYIAIDGVVPMAKMHQQRLRRFKSPIMKEWENDLKKKFGVFKEEIFDTNQITPGTEFMSELSAVIKTSISSGALNIASNVKTYFSDANSPGEGEHKVMNHMNNLESSDEIISVYGLDADLVMLSLIQKHKNLFLLREDVNQKKLEDEKQKFIYVSIDNLRENLYKEFLARLKHNFKVDRDVFVKDYVFLCFLLGNDFIHSLPSLKIKYGGVDFIVNLYIKILGYVKKKIVQDDNSINHSFLLKIFENLNNCEESNLKYIQNKNHDIKLPNFDDTYSEEKFKHDRVQLNELFKNRKISIDFKAKFYKNKYYKEVFNLDINDSFDAKEVDLVCKKYLEGLKFTSSYYFDKNIFWEWYYPLNYSPFASDIYKNLKKINNINNLEINVGNPVKPIEQLMMVLPKYSVSILPKSVQNIILDSNSTINQYYPSNYEFDFYDKYMLYSIEPKLPIIDIEKIRVNFKLCSLNSNEKLRNKEGELFTFFK